MSVPAAPRCVRDPDQMHVAGLLLGRLLERAAAGGPPALPGNIGVVAGGMAATIVPGPERLEVVPGLALPLAAAVEAPLRTLFEVCAGGSLLRALLRGGLRLHGNPRALLALRAVLRAAKAAP